MDILLEHQISAVTVYPDQARVTTAGEAALEAGRYRLILDELPLALDPASLRAAGRGSARVRILALDVRRAQYEQAPAAKVRELEAEIERREADLKVVSDALAVLAAQQSHLEGLRQATKQYAQGLARGKTSVEDQARLTEFLREQDEANRAAGRELDARQLALNRTVDKLRRELAQLQAARPKQRQQASIELEVLSAGDFQAEVSYLVRGAGWQPLYDVRFDGRSQVPALTITTLAQVSQTTGQDWQGVALSVSTARPEVNAQRPELKPWYLDVARPAPPPRPARVAPAKAMTLAAAADQAPVEAFGGPVSEAAEAVVAVASASASETTVSYAVAGQSDVPGDGSPRKVTLSQFELEPMIDYLSIPKQSPAAYRRLKARLEAAGPLLAGSANLFVGDDFIGATHLDYLPDGDELVLLLGAEERITVERALVLREVDKVLLRDRRQLRYGYQIALHNLMAREVEIELHDQAPVPRHEEIKVRLERATPPPAEHSDLNLLAWHLKLPAGAEQKVSFEFSVEHPRPLQVVGLRD
ncbi:MAG: mucoidy inhibitor MuiA family protein [Candidatus Promineifilaceae bacterium]